MISYTNIIFNEKMTFLMIGGRSTQQDNKLKLQADEATHRGLELVLYGLPEAACSLKMCDCVTLY